MKILITGSSGNIGYCLCRYFMGKKINVVGLDIEALDLLPESKYFKFYNCDITERLELLRIFKNEKPTHVIHLAFNMKPLHDLVRERAVDVGGSINVISEAIESPSVKQFVEFSSTSAYGADPGNEPWIKERRELRPGEYRYGEHKKEVEDYINTVEARKGLKFVIVRMCTAVGPSEHKKGGLVELIHRTPFLLSYDYVYAKLQLLHEDDLTTLIHKIANDRNIEGTFNLAPDSFSDIRELVPKKRFIDLPLWFVKWLTGILWSLRLTNLYPPAIEISAYPIIADPEKLMKRYKYKFKYTTKTAYEDAVRGLKDKGML